MAQARTTARSRGSAGEPAEAEPSAERDHVCPVAFCPIGAALTAVNHASPDVLEHLLAAAREFLLAARAVVDTRAADFERDGDGSNLERIDIA